MKSQRLLTCGLLTSVCVCAQETARVYGFVAPTITNASTATPAVPPGILPPPTTVTPVSTTTYAAGLGVVFRLGNNGGLAERFGAGIDFSAITPSKGIVGSEVLGNVSFSGYYHPRSNSDLDPYVIGGYSALFRDFGANGGNVGAGVNYFFGGHWGLMFEVRELVFANSPSLPATHYTQFRIGPVYRRQ